MSRAARKRDHVSEPTPDNPRGSGQTTSFANQARSRYDTNQAHQQAQQLNGDVQIINNQINNNITYNFFLTANNFPDVPRSTSNDISRTRQNIRSPPPTSFTPTSPNASFSPPPRDSRFSRSDYEVRPGQFFTTGRVFTVSCPEPVDGTILKPKILRECMTEASQWQQLVVVRQSRDCCYAVPISTYGGQGVAKRGVKKSDHAVIYAGEQRPFATSAEMPKRGEAGMQPVSIKVELEDTRDRLDPRARVDFGRRICVQHNIRAKPFGVIDPASMKALQYQFMVVSGQITGFSGAGESDIYHGSKHVIVDQDHEAEEDSVDYDDSDDDDGDGDGDEGNDSE
ncbi:hypothetical protein MBLNU13_g09625t1 [Cladosporium sp. NU13]